MSCKDSDGDTRAAEFEVDCIAAAGLEHRYAVTVDKARDQTELRA